MYFLHSRSVWKVTIEANACILISLNWLNIKDGLPFDTRTLWLAVTFRWRNVGNLEELIGGILDVENVVTVAYSKGFWVVAKLSVVFFESKTLHP